VQRAGRRYPAPVALSRGRTVAIIATATVVVGLVAGGSATAAPRKAAARHVVTPPPPPRRVQLGTAVRWAALRGDSAYRDLFLSQYNALTPENEMKMPSLQPRRGVYDFNAADDLVAFAKRHHKAIHGHALVWGLQLPLWLIDHGASDDLGLHLPPLSVGPPLDAALGGLLTNLTGWQRPELLAIMRDHVTTVMRHFGDDVPEWDVVNEPLEADGNLQNNVWRHFIGPDYIELALRAARAANPRAKLFINEYAVEQPGPKRDGLIALVRDLKARGVPLDGVGLQYHTHVQGFIDELTMRDTMQQLAALGVQVQITEMDVGTSLLDGTNALRQQRQATAYGDAARACNAIKACTRLTTWGFTDRVSWLAPTEMGLPFDAQLRPKPAFDAISSALASPSARGSRGMRHVLRPARPARVRVRKTAGPA
jgi:endo-1,4-beta-xylanase